MITIPNHCGHHFLGPQGSPPPAHKSAQVGFELEGPEFYSPGYLARLWEGLLNLWGRVSFTDPGRAVGPAGLWDLPLWAARRSGEVGAPHARGCDVGRWICTAVKPAPSASPNPDCALTLRTLRQRRGDSCGQTCVAMVVTALTGKRLNDDDVNRRHGYRLTSALNQECRAWGYRFRDIGNFGPGSWARIEASLRQRIPVIIGLNGQFSPSGRGHVVAIVGLQEDCVRYADPATGSIRTTTRQAIERAPGHPQGKFLLCGERSRSHP